VPRVSITADGAAATYPFRHAADAVAALATTLVALAASPPRLGRKRTEMLTSTFITATAVATANLACRAAIAHTRAVGGIWAQLRLTDAFVVMADLVAGA
jgi:hypothetical protein